MTAAPDAPHFRMILSLGLFALIGGPLNFVDLFYTEQDPPLTLECTAALMGPDGAVKSTFRATVLVGVEGETWYRFRSSDWLYEGLDAAMQRAEAVLAAKVAGAG